MRLLFALIAIPLSFACVLSSSSSAESRGLADAAGAVITADKQWILALDGTARNTAGTSPRGKGTGRWPRVVRGVSNDAAGGIYLSGSFFGQVELGGVALSSHGRSDMLVGRIDSGGRILWLHSFGGPGTDIAPDVVEDSQGRALLTGMISAGARVGGQEIKTAGGSDVFTAQLSPDGEILWLHTAGGKQADSGNEIATDGEDNVLVAANSYGHVQAEDAELQHRGGMDGFLLKYNALGQLLWMRQIAGPADEQLRGIAADKNGHITVVGEFTGTVAIEGESLTAASKQRDILIARYTPLGTLLWSRRFGGSGEDYARGVDVDQQGNLYVAGVFSGSVKFDDITLAGGGKQDQLFVLRLSPNGKVQWAREISGSGSGHGCELDVIDNGHVLVSCDVMGELELDGMPVGSRGRRDSFVAVFDSEGKARNVIALGASAAAANFDVVGDLTGRLASLVGVFEGTVAIGSGKVQSSPDSSAFIARIALDNAASNQGVGEAPAESTSTSPRQGLRKRDRDPSAMTGRGLPESPDPGYTGASAGPYQVEELTVNIPAERWQKEMTLRIYSPVEPGPYPVIVFCAGSSGDNDTFRLTSNYLASHGYVVVHNSYTRQRGLGNEQLTRNRVLDVELVLDALDGSLLPLEGKIDKSKIGAMGHSSGAYITQLIGGAVVSWDGKQESFRDPRIDAILMYSGQGSGQQGLTRASWQQLTTPMMAMTGSSDRGAFSQAPSWRREPFELSRGPGKYLLWYDRGHHGSFSGKFARNRATRAIFEHAQETTLAFFNAYLKDDGDALEFLNSSQPESLNSATVEYFWK